MRGLAWIVTLLAALLISGCSREDADDAQEHEEESAKPTQGSGLPQDNVFSDQVKTLEKAKGVQQTLDDATAKQREEIERQEQR